MSWDDGSKNEDTTSKGREISKNDGDDFFTRGESGNEQKEHGMTSNLQEWPPATRHIFSLSEVLSAFATSLKIATASWHGTGFISTHSKILGPKPSGQTIKWAKKNIKTSREVTTER